MWQLKSVAHWACKLAMRTLLLAGTTSLLVPLALVPRANAQITVGIGVSPPICSYGYYDYSPYGCAPMGFYGPGYFYNGVFLGVGPWANWGYGHGWGEHRFSDGGGGRYRGGRGNGGERFAGGRGNGRAYAANRGGGSSAVRSGRSNGGNHAAAARGGASHGTSHAAAARGGASHGGGGGSHGGGPHASAESHSGGEHH